MLSPAPSNCVCTALRMAGRVVTREYDRALAPVGLRAGGYAILARLDQEGPLSLTALAARLAMDRSTLSRESGPLLEAGLLESNADARDGRRRLLSLSAAGSERVAEARPLWAGAQRTLSEGFGGTRTAELVHELHALVGAGA
jgi:DNA-binding MarR family transcriptional regulator